MSALYSQPVSGNLLRRPKETNAEVEAELQPVFARL